MCPAPRHGRHRTVSDLSPAFDVSQWMTQARTDMLTASGFTQTDLHRAVKRNRKLLHARKVKHIVLDGQVTEHVTPDNDAQLRAVDMIYDLAGVKAPRAASSSVSAGVEVVIDPSSGQVIVRAVTK
jgi:c-di-AMP phosphodiesterase-like protein